MQHYNGFRGEVESDPGPFQWADKRVLVFGATGFLGCHLASALVQRGAQVHASSRQSRDSAQPGLTWLVTDVTSLDSVKTSMSRVRPHAVFHFSSLADGRPDLSLTLPTLHAEVLSTVNVLIASVDARVERVVLPGSLEEPEDGDAPSSPYAAAKLASRNYARMFSVLYGLSIVNPRLFMCYGPGQPEWKIIPYTARCLLAGNRPIIASPDRAVDWIYVTDAVDGLMAAVDAPFPECESLDIGSGSLVRIRDVTERLRSLVNPGVEVDYSSAAPRARERVRRADIETTFRRLKWKPAVSLDEGLRRTVLDLVSKESMRGAGTGCEE